jgi:hypothetical protein
VRQETRGAITYDLFSVEGGDVAVAHGLPVLPYVKAHVLRLPFGTTVREVDVVKTSAPLGPHEVPIAQVHPFTQGGVRYGTESELAERYPPDEELVQYQKTSEGLLFTVFPVQHNPGTKETFFSSQFTVEVSYETPVTVAVSDFTTDKTTYVPGESIGTTTRIENVGDGDAVLEATLSVTDALGQVVGTQNSSEFSVPASGHFLLPLSWTGVLDDDAYTIQVSLWSAGTVLDGASAVVSVLAGAITEFAVPRVVWLGEEGTFQVTFSNYGPADIDGQVLLGLQDDEGSLVEDLAPREMHVEAGSSETVTFTWTPVGVRSGLYTATVTVTVDDRTYGPIAKSFAVTLRPEGWFRRGDADDNAELEITDAVRILGFLFLGGVAPTCLEAADADNNGGIEVTDAIRILGYLFVGGPAPEPPGPPGPGVECGPDDDWALGCDSYTSC